MRHIIRAVILSSPSITPIKGKVQRDVSLRVFSDTGRTKIFNYGFRKLEEYADEDLEIVDLPDIQWNPH